MIYSKYVTEQHLILVSGDGPVVESLLKPGKFSNLELAPLGATHLIGSFP